MSSLGVQLRRAPLRTAARRRPGGPGRFPAEAAPPLFADGGDTTPVIEGPVVGSDAVGPQVDGAGTPGGRGEGATLEELVRGLWEGVLAQERVACPMCGGELVGRASAHARPTEGCCRDCGTTIA